MICSRTPFRISIGGGGTDHPFYFKLKGSKFISATINQYIYVFITKRLLDKKILTQTSKIQFTTDLEKISHIYIREVLRYFKIKDSIQIGTFSTLPSASGIGLGTSSSLLVGLINCLSVYKKLKFSKMEIAKIAHHIERNIIKQEGGYQDQYISSIGGVQKFMISKKGIINQIPNLLKKSNHKFLEKNGLLVYSNIHRESDNIIKSQKSKNNLQNNILLLDKIKKIGNEIELAISENNLNKVANLFNEHWIIKKKLSSSISSRYLDEQLNTFKTKGAIGGKIIGAGGGGFFYLLTNKKRFLKNTLTEMGHYCLDLKFDHYGTKIIKL